MFLLLLLAPDIFMVGYLKNTKLGATLYNLGHTFLLGLLLMLLGMLGNNLTLIQVGLIFIAHVGMDRFLGFGLKYPTHFKDTHIQKV